MPQYQKIVILGANAQIARSLIVFLASNDAVLFTLFTHRPELLQKHLSGMPNLAAQVEIQTDYRLLEQQEYNILINCIGAGSPGKMQGDHSLWYDITEKYDCLALKAIRQNSPQAIYVNFSSGAVYGRGRNLPCQIDDQTAFQVNHLRPQDYYPLMRLNAEARHRAHPAMRIADLRIFSFFSRFSSCDDGYFLSEVLTALLYHQKLQVSPVNTIRDYIHPSDLAQLIQICARQPVINAALDVYSREPCEKFTILKELGRAFGLQYEILPVERNSLNGSCDVYYSANHKAAELGYQPEFTSMEVILSEIRFFLDHQSGL